LRFVYRRVKEVFKYPVIPFLKGSTVSFTFDPAKSPLKNIEAAITGAGYDVKGRWKNYSRM
jgi:hypothetical protein